MKMTNKLALDELKVPKDVRQPKLLNAMDPRISKHYDMLGQANATVPVN
jgi:hypothetical protein